ncbi:1-acyl-sn-glycerol-3-phosphate acyltransferase [Cylindrospermopsis raciborskii]|uniref:1-acyl-sn-glycerol-3-phosphate acyltransferase n=1 Tax=Cylindrospermopsis raciborskii CENA302 TaxID=1170768 RepID=A0A9Q5QYP5_9CYAN|nr:1-acyl-sn-glycerol-3-phosphate acyltransferase [Cylindrospermopsis raciborskii]MCZ2201438.1 1-acyl-sn-glycerol-3-phosphate acyltransferase [Cylindrospermopsis raciborskii PAMP2012]MCZ2205095.1 1-acyl-sn-glycerol-3-phosphate acyltransferase [Cylindrospermopsis raciborskii PAMP2011]NLQ06558.1 1-acyl-sn-glycerol-3-phosphate acyltransferase [Cylindrospermopsis raciborskii MVCC19]OHY34356.1 glycerol acyltransferase [Cylindrospermopsis raciborskii MVCC14]OPH10805.1 1-acyl-sn-glycerol-3-phosphate 
MKESHSASTSFPGQSPNICLDPPFSHTRSWISPWLTPLAYWLGYHLVIPLFFGSIHVAGQQHIPIKGPVILAPTHRSRWDPLLLAYAVGRYITGRDLRFMVMSSECRGIQGWFILSMGGFAVNLQRPGIRSLRHALDLMLGGEMLVIYPEGGIFRDGKIHPLKSGIARLSINAQSLDPNLDIKIVPVAINYDRPYPNWGTKVKICIGEPVKVMDYMDGCLKQNAKYLTRDLRGKLQEVADSQPDFSLGANCLTNS